MNEQVIDRRYITYSDHFETGCGRTIHIGLFFASDEIEARLKHVEDVYHNDKIAQDYFRGGVDAYPIDSNEAKEIMNMWFVPFVYTQLLTGSREKDFSLKLHYNLS